MIDEVLKDVEKVIGRALSKKDVSEATEYLLKSIDRLAKKKGADLVALAIGVFLLKAHVKACKNVEELRKATDEMAKLVRKPKPNWEELVRAKFMLSDTSSEVH